MQLQLTGKELEFLIYAQMQDDWYWESFPDILERFQEEFSFSGNLPNLQNRLWQLPEERMVNLQHALVNLCDLNLIMLPSAEESGNPNVGNRNENASLSE